MPISISIGIGLGQTQLNGGAPAVPTAPSAFALEQWSLTRGNGLLTVGIDSLPYNGNSPITRVEYRLNGGAAVSSGGVVGFNITGLTNGTPYGVELRAVNTVGNGAWSDLKSATPATVPSAPTIAATPANGQATITNTDGATGGSPITTRLLYRSTTTGFTPGAGNLIATNPTYPYIDTGLTNGTVYYYKAVNGNAVGNGAASTQASAQPVAAPSWSVAPSISGTAQVGQTLTGSDGTIVNGTATSRQWKRGGDDIAGANSTTYLLTSTDLDALITYQVNATGVGGPASATSAAVGPVAAAPAVAPVLTFDGTTFTSNLPGQFQVDGVNVGPSNATTLTYNSGTMLGKWVGITNGVLSNIIVIEATNPVTTINFNQADGTLLSAYPGTPFTVLGGDTTEQNKYTCQSNAARVASLSGTTPQAKALRSSGTNHFVAAKATGGDPPRILASCSDASNCLLVEVNDLASGRWLVNSVVANAFSNQTPNGITVAGSGGAGVEREIVVVNREWQFRVNGLPYAKSSSFGSPSEQTDVWYPFPEELPDGNYVGFAGDEYGVRVLDDMRYGSLSQPITITSIEVYEDGGDQKLRIIGTADAGALDDAVVLLTLGSPEQLVQDWTVADGAPGAPGGVFTIEDISFPTGLSGQDLNVYLSDNTTRSLTTSQVFPVPFAARGFTKGINNSGKGVNFRNLFSRLEIRFTDNLPYPEDGPGYLLQPGATATRNNVGASTVGMGYDGIIQSYAAGHQNAMLYLCNGEVVEQGIYEIYYPSAMSCVLTDVNGGTLTDATILTAFSGGYGKIQIAVDKPSLRFTFSGGTSGSLNLKPTGYLESDTNRSRLYAESSIVPFITADAKVERYLDSLYANGDGVLRVTPDQIWIGGAGVGGPFSPEMVAQKANAQGTDVWIPCSYLWQGEEYLTAYFTRLIAALDADRKVYVEPPNETWNRQFKAFYWAIQNGVQSGFAPSEITSSAEATPLVSFWAVGGVDYDNFTGYMLRTYAEDDVVIFDNFDGVGAFWARAKHAIVTGATDKIEKSGSQPIDNAAWEVLGNNLDAERAQKRWYANWADYLYGIVDQAAIDEGYDPSSKIVHVLAWQTGDPKVDILEWNGIYERFDAWAEAPYWGRSLLRYDDSPMTLTEKNYLGTDIPAFKAAFNAYAAADVAATVAEFAGRKASSEAVFASFGLLPNEKRLISYEMGWHVETEPDVTDGTTGHWHPNMATVYPELRRQSVMQTWTTDYYTGWAEVYRDTGCQYYGVEELADSYNGRFGFWGAMESNDDTTNPVILGFAAVPNGL